MLGVNLDAVSDSSPQRPFVNMFKSARQPGPVTKPEAGGMAGYPTGDFGLVVWTVGACPAGQYVITGNGILSQLKLLWGGSILTQQINASRFRVVVNIPVGQTQFALGFYGSGWSNLSMTPTALEQSAEVFSPEFIAAVSGFNGIRCMDWLRTNNSTCASFANRPQVNDLTYSLGVPYEICTALANKINCDLWINVPHLWNFQDFDSLAKLFASLPVRGTLYTEYSNEVWNSIFTQYAWNQAQAQAMFPDEPNTFYRGYQRAGIAHNELGRAFIQEGVPCRPVLATHIGDSTKWRQAIKGIGTAKRYVTHMAGAPYFGNSDFMKRNDLKVDNFFGPYNFTDSSGTVWSGQNYMMDRAVKSITGSTVALFLSDAKANGLTPCIYEFGKDFGDWHNADGTVCSHDAKIAASNDPRMALVLKGNLDSLPDQTIPRFYFVLCSKYDRFTWGLTPDIGTMSPMLAEAKKHLTPETNVTITAMLLDLATNTVSPLAGTLDFSGKKTIQFATNTPAVSLMFTVADATGKVILNHTETGAPYQLNGDNVAWNPGVGTFVLAAAAYDANKKILGSATWSLVVGVAPVDPVQQQVNALTKQVADLTSQMTGLQTSYSALQAKFDQIRQIANT